MARVTATFSELDNLVLHLKGLVLVLNLRRRSGADEAELGMFSAEIDRARDQLARFVKQDGGSARHRVSSVPVRSLVERGRGTELIDLSLAELARDEHVTSGGEGERCAVVQSGVVEAAVDGAALGRVGGRADVFDEPATPSTCRPGRSSRSKLAPRRSIALASAPLDGRAPGAARLIRSDEQRVAEAGVGNWSRAIRTVLGPDDDAGRLIVARRSTRPGTGRRTRRTNTTGKRRRKRSRSRRSTSTASSRRQASPYRSSMATAGRRTRIVRDGDVVAIPSGITPSSSRPATRSTTSG